MHGWAPEVIGAVGAPEPTRRATSMSSFHPPARAKKRASKRPGASSGRTNNRDEPTTWQTRQAQYDAVCAWGIPNHSLLQRVAAIALPVFVANGDSDPMILSALLVPVGRASPKARLKIYRTRPTASSSSTRASSPPTYTRSSRRTD